MTPDATPPLPGSMTVPPLFGWEQLMVPVAVVVVLAVVALLLLATSRASSERSEWQAWLDGRSARRRDG
jgi:hypothetical protein